MSNRNSVGEEPLSAVQQWMQNEEPFIFGVTESSTPRRPADLSGATSGDVRDMWRHQVTPCSACSMKPWWGREQTVGESRVERKPGWKDVSIWAAQPRWDLCMIPTGSALTHMKLLCFKTQHPPPEESGFIASVPTTWSHPLVLFSLMCKPLYKDKPQLQ